MDDFGVVHALPDHASDAGDSSYEDSASSTASISSSVFAYEQEHGRTYHAYQAGKYVLPNDEEEQDRMDIQYHAIRLLFENKPFFAPIGEKPERIVDFGTGTGIWAMDVGDAYPNATVIGTDLSPIQPTFVCPNVQFEINDVTDIPWTYKPNSFDLVHTRIMNGFGIRNWTDFYRESYNALKPGGWVESQEFSLEVNTDDASLPPDSAITKWCDLLYEGALTGAGQKLRLTGDELRVAMEEAGFVDITIRNFKLPIGPWAADEKLRETGQYALLAMLEGLFGISVAIFTRFLGWEIGELEVLLALVRAEWRRRKVHTYWPLFAAYGRKPLVAQNNDGENY